MRFGIVGLVLLALIGAIPAHAQQSASLSGFVKDATSGETLLLANVILVGTSYGTATNTTGYYTLTN
ncbi:MAG TPA: carboxypeptidase-like regulatory domain-containing protein, partial [Rhodothermales bacterium]|nr:carboxypeptidase-like regulatory domain-containing protein [Rhodothermales bacterium]